MKKYILLSIIALGSISCTDSFLEEKMVSTITQDYFETEQGLEQLIVRYIRRLAGNKTIRTRSCKLDGRSR